MQQADSAIMLANTLHQTNADGRNKKQKEGHKEGKTEYRRQKKTSNRNTSRRKTKKESHKKTWRWERNNTEIFENKVGFQELPR